MYKTYDEDRVKAFCETPPTADEFAEEFGVTRNAARAAMRRRGICPAKEDQTDLRRAVLDMKPSDAVEMLLSVIEKMRGQPEKLPEKLAFASDLTPYPRKLLAALYAAPSMTLTRDALVAAIYGLNMWDAPEKKIVDVYVCQIRKVLPP